MESNEMMVPQKDFAAGLTGSEVSTFCSMQVKTDEDRKKLFNAMSNPTGRVKDMVNLKLKIKDIFCESAEVNHVDEATGVVTQVTLPRIVLITDKGESYQAVSTGIFNAVKRLITVFGPPTWETPIEVTVKQITKDKNNILTLEL